MGEYVTLELDVERLQLKYDYSDRVIRNNVKVFCVKFNLDSMWNGTTKTVTFENVSSEVSISKTVNYSEQTEIPFEVLKNNGELYITLFGKNSSGQEYRTMKMRRPFKVNDCGSVSDVENVVESHTILHDLVDIRDDLTNKLESGYFNGESVTSCTVEINEFGELIMTTNI